MKKIMSLFTGDSASFRHTGAVITVFGLVLLCLIWIGVFYKAHTERQLELQGAVRETGNFARAFEEHTARTILSADQMLLLLKYQYEINGKAMDMAPFKRGGPFWNPTFLLMGIADENSDFIISNQEPHVPSNLKDREHIQVHVKADTGKIFIGKPVIGRSSGKPSINMTRRINKPDGSYGGTAIVAVDPFYFTGFYQQVDLGKNSSVSLVGRDGIVRARQTDQSADVGQDLSRSPFMESQKSAAGHYEAASQIDGIKRIYSFRALQDNPFVVVVGVDEAEVLRGWNQRVDAYYLIAMIVTIVILAFIVTLLRVAAQQKRSADLLETELNERKMIQQELNGRQRCVRGCRPRQERGVGTLAGERKPLEDHRGLGAGRGDAD